jgi:prolyl-tRNA editing enzyme YbaK/EbsC (Cys-tRNA(Pro) deacylase)
VSGASSGASSARGHRAGGRQPGSPRVHDALRAFGGEHTIVELPEAARTAADAARLVGCRVEQIANSLVFRAPARDAAILVIASGGRRVDPARIAEALGEAVDKADADFVRARTGFVIGGVAPVGHTAAPAAILIDEELLAWAEIWAAGGHPHTVFRLTPEELVRMTRGRVVKVR